MIDRPTASSLHPSEPARTDFHVSLCLVSGSNLEEHPGAE
jgi:hypothetical protein